MKTKSEKLFEKLCVAQGLRCNKIEEGGNKSPDYLVSIDSLEFVVEVKQVNPNKEQNKLLAEFEKKRSVVFSATPGESVRSKINKSAAQISILAKGKMPGMLVLYNSLPSILGDPFGSYNIRVGMFGFDTIVLTKPRDFSAPTVLDRKFGPKKKVTKEHNTSISALAVINKKVPNQLDVYHNPHAAIPFRRGLFQEFGNREYELEEKLSMRFHEWKEVGS